MYRDWERGASTERAEQDQYTPQPKRQPGQERGVHAGKRARMSVHGPDQAQARSREPSITSRGTQQAGHNARTKQGCRRNAAAENGLQRVPELGQRDPEVIKIFCPKLNT